MLTVTGVAVIADDGRSVDVTEGVGWQVSAAVFGAVRCRVLTEAGVAVVADDGRTLVCVSVTGYVDWQVSAAVFGVVRCRVLTEVDVTGVVAGVAATGEGG